MSPIVERAIRLTSQLHEVSLSVIERNSNRVRGMQYIVENGGCWHDCRQYYGWVTEIDEPEKGDNG